jgi:predicted RNase H-like HicB family nuclease
MAETEVTYTVHVHHEQGTMWAEVEELPGCFATGDTWDELEECLTEAISLYLSTPEQPTVVRLSERSPVQDTVQQRFTLCPA